MDVDAREALVQGLNEYEGAVILISHDPHLVSLVADDLWLVAEGGVKRFDGDIEDYKKLVLETARSAGAGKPISTAEKHTEQPRLSGKEARKQRAQNRAAMAPLRKEISKLENQIQKLESEKGKLEDIMAAPETYEKGSDYQAKIVAEIGDLNSKLEKIEAEWMLKQEELEGLEA